jgi:hypothetical protein
MSPLSTDELLAQAKGRTGLHDFGDDSFREGLERLVWSLNEEATLSAIGRHAMPALLVHLLSQRLEVEDWYHRHPEIDEEPIEAPLIGLGLPRTGSTALSFLLAEDPNARSLRLFEGTQPCPPPSTVASPDPRIARAEANFAAQAKLMPRMASLVPSTPTGPYECQDLMGLDFRSHYFHAYAHVPSYSDWLLHEADLTSTYRYERRVLKLLQWGEPIRRPWRLKCPTHLLFLPQLDQAFPDARFVMTHRDPTDVMVSVADVFLEVSKMMSEQVDLPYLGRLNVEHWSVGMERALAFRDAGNGHRFYDMHFQAVQRDPIGEVRGLYQWLGEPVTEAFEQGMARWWREHAETRAPNVHPDPATFGLDLEAVRPRFAKYVERMEQWTAR